MGLVAPWHVGSSQTRARTRVPCIGRQILNHCATREAPCVPTFNPDTQQCLRDPKMEVGGWGEGTGWVSSQNIPEAAAAHRGLARGHPQNMCPRATGSPLPATCGV